MVRNTLCVYSVILCLQMLNCSEEERPEPTLPRWCAGDLTWSPDGSTIAFMYVPIEWDTLMEEYVTVFDSIGLWFINADGSNLRMFMHYEFSRPDYHPNGDSIIAGGCLINVIDTVIIPRPWVKSNPRYNPDGSKIVYACYYGDSMGLWMVNADGSDLHCVLREGWKADWSPGGNELVCVVYPFRPTPLVIADTSGTILTELPVPLTYSAGPIISVPSFSPDGSKILFEYQTDSLLENYDVYVINPNGGGLTRLTDDGGVHPVWSPDGSKIAYVKYDHWGSEEAGDGQLWVMNADGTGKRQLTFVRESEER